MRSEHELREAVRRSAEGLDADADLAAVRRRARVLRTRRALGGVVVVGILAAAVILPLRALLPVAEPPPPRPAEEPEVEVEAEIFFPTMAEDWGGAGPDAGIGGTIDEWNGCLRIGGSLVLWPHGWTIEQRGENLTVLDEEGRPVLVVGDQIEGGGGNVGGGGRDGVAFPQHLIGEPIPHRCRSTGYWLLKPTPWLEVTGHGGSRLADIPKEILAEGQSFDQDWQLLAWRWGRAPCLSLHPLGGLSCGIPRDLSVMATPSSSEGPPADMFFWGTVPSETELITAEADDGRTVEGRLFPVEGTKRLLAYLVIVEDARSVLLDATDAEGRSIDQYRWYP